MSEHGEDTKTINGLVVNNVLAFPLGKQKPEHNHLNRPSALWLCPLGLRGG